MTLALIYDTGMHHIQRQILGTLLYATSLPYAGMRPKGVESNHFAYHLAQLTRDKLIAKTGSMYTLSPQGLAFVDRLSQHAMVERLQPHIVTAIDVTDNQGRTVLFQRSFQPYIHTWSFPLGKTHYDESVAQAASRELREKTDLGDIPLTHRGMVYLHITQHDITISKILCHVFQGRVNRAPAVTGSPTRGVCRWIHTDTLDAADLMPGFFEIKKLLGRHHNGLFFDEFRMQLAPKKIPAEL